MTSIEMILATYIAIDHANWYQLGAKLRSPSNDFPVAVEQSNWRNHLL
jgi:hypothetical protein